MSRPWTASLLLAALSFALAPSAFPQDQQPPSSTVVTKSVTAIGYQVGGGSTKIDLQGTNVMPQAEGQVKVQAGRGATSIQATVRGLSQPTALGAEFLTFVLWSVSPEGSTSNLGEIQRNSEGNGKLNTSTQLQTFSLIVTAEPYFSVRYPSEFVVLENAARNDTKGKVIVVKEYQLLQRAQYQKLGNPLALTPDLRNVPLEIYEARNAVDIAKSRGAEKYAPEIFSKALASLQTAEGALASRQDKKTLISSARETVQFAEDSRALAVARQEQERIARERAAAAADAKAQAEAKAAAEAQRQAELAAAKQAQMKAEAEADAAKAQAQADAAAAKAKAEADAAAAAQERLKAQADAAAAKAQAEADALRAREQAAKADAERARLAAEQLRAQLLDQFNRVLETRDTVRGLVVNLGDVLFDTGRYTLRSEAREKLAKLSGIILAHPGLHLAVEGYTDSTGSDEFNQKLSEQRAGTVRDYLVGQGLGEDSVSATGFGKASPVADNASAAGRQKNRRVEIVVSGEVIGVQIGK